MAQDHAVIIEENLRIPAQALSFEGFRRWVHSADFPEQGRVDFLAGDVEVDMSPEDLHTHGIVKVAVAGALHALVAERDLGEAFVDSTRVVSRFAGLSVEPDVVVVLWETLSAGRVRYVPAASGKPDRYCEIEGAPDLVVEVVSDSSQRKDTERLPPLYARAGVPELWTVDVRDDEVRLRVQTLREGSYMPVPPSVQGWTRSPVLGFELRLSRRRTPLGTWTYSLEHR